MQALEEKAEEKAAKKIQAAMNPMMNTNLSGLFTNKDGMKPSPDLS